MSSSPAVPQESNQGAPAAGTPTPAPPTYIPTADLRRGYYREDPRYKSPALATLLSLMPGLGQIYVGYYQLGFINILVVASLIALLNRGAGHLEPLFGLFLAFYWLYNLVDAARRATFYNQALAGLGPTEMPEGMKMPDRRGALLGGILMILVGAAAFAHIQFGMSFQWMERWWPLALVLVGAYLTYQSATARKKEKK
jgi:hypothetical protein